MKKLLVVDDSDVNLYLIQSIFEDDEDIQILIENDSRNTIELLKKHKPHVLVLDLMMPKLNGFDVLEQINKDNSIKTKVVIISAHLNETTIEKLENYNIKHFFNKPLDLDIIEKNIKKILLE